MLIPLLLGQGLIRGNFFMLKNGLQIDKNLFNNNLKRGGRNNG